METLYNGPGFYGVVAEREGAVVGSNWLDERNAISGIGPVTIDPEVQDGGLGRLLMDAVIERSDARGFPGVRLVQAAFHARSLSLYTKLGFASREEIAVMDGGASDPNLTGYTVRPLRPDDLSACNQICANVHGFDRGTELAAAGDRERGVRCRTRRRNPRVHFGLGLPRSLCRRDDRRDLRLADGGPAVAEPRRARADS